MQRDPIGYWDSNNLYQYALNNPINFIDPTGEGAEQVLEVGYFLIWITVIVFVMHHQQSQTCPPTQIDVPEWIPILLPVILPLVGSPPIALNGPLFSQKGDQNQRDSGLAGLSDEEISRRARDKSLSGEARRRYQKEEKARGLRNKKKR